MSFALRRGQSCRKEVAYLVFIELGRITLGIILMDIPQHGAEGSPELLRAPIL